MDRKLVNGFTRIASEKKIYRARGVIHFNAVCKSIANTLHKVAICNSSCVRRTEKLIFRLPHRGYYHESVLEKLPFWSQLFSKSLSMMHDCTQGNLSL